GHRHAVGEYRGLAGRRGRAGRGRRRYDVVQRRDRDLKRDREARAGGGAASQVVARRGQGRCYGRIIGVEVDDRVRGDGSGERAGDGGRARAGGGRGEG